MIVTVGSVALLGTGCGKNGAEVASPNEKPVISVTRTTVAPATSTKADDSQAGWQTYADSAGRFSFRHPSGTYVTADKSGNKLTILPAPPKDTPVPDMTITIANGDVHFATWENFDIPYFKGLVSSFEFK